MSDILITSWLFTARWSMWPGNHLVPCVAELVGSCIPIHKLRCLPDPKCLFYPSGLSLCLSVYHFCLVQSMTWFSSVGLCGWLVSYTALPCRGGSGLCTSCERVHFFLVFLDPHTEIPACLSNIRAGTVLVRHTWDQVVGSCIPIHALQCLPDPKCLFYPSGLSLCLSVDHFCLVPVDDMVLICWSVWLTCELHCSPLPWRLGSVYQLWKSPLLSCVPWSPRRNSCLSLQHKSWNSSCKAHMGPGDLQVTCSMEL